MVMIKSDSFRNGNKERIYFMKFYDTIVCEIVESNGLFSMEILKPELFFDRINKLNMGDKEFRVWMTNRLRPSTQVGVGRLYSQLNLDESDENFNFNLFIKTRGTNVKDKLWLSLSEDEDYDENSPWFKVEMRDSMIKDISEYNDDILTLNTTKTILNIDGACEKDLFRIDGNLCIVKRPLQHNTYDCLSEEICYRLAKRLGVDCAPAGYIKDDLCYSIIDESKDLIHAGDLVNLDSGSLEDFYNKLKRLPKVTTKLKLDVLRMGLFDLITRQLDRNFTNFSFYYEGDNLRMYQLYDNGLSLFSSSRFIVSLDFNLGRTKSSDQLNFIVRELKNLKVSKVFSKKIEGLHDSESCFNSSISSVTYFKYKNGNNSYDVMHWVLQMQDLVEYSLKEAGINFC